ncbi:MAG: RlmE family RNA methyltransferase [Desulfovibrio sp.]|nr:RlmE family RNA methyltransferase [Desulfovibrio sp.]
MKNYRDHYFLKAKLEHYPARSVYKLQELDRRFRIFKKGMRVLDLGAAPGSWTLYAAEKTGSQGFVLGADLKSTETAFPPQVLFLQEDVHKPSPQFAALLRDRGPFQVVLSDMAPATTGHRVTDQARSSALCREAFGVARICLERGGSFVLKVFMGPDVKKLSDDLRLCFDAVKSFKPAGSRPESMETFYAALGFRGRGSESQITGLFP